MPVRLKNGKHTFRMGMSAKLAFSVSAIVIVLLISGIISFLEFRRMSNYVSERISDNIECINLSTELAVRLDEYNVRILSIVGKADSIKVSGLDHLSYISVTDALVGQMNFRRLPFTDSLTVAYEKYKEMSYTLDDVIVSDFIDSRDWYFTSLQPVYNNLRVWQDKVNMSIHDAMRRNSVSFDESFYRSIMPGIASVGVGILLSILLLVYILVFYVRPLKRMLSSLDSYKRFSQPYSVSFEGDDQLQDLNGNIGELVGENSLLRKRLRERER